MTGTSVLIGLVVIDIILSCIQIWQSDGVERRIMRFRNEVAEDEP